MNSWFLRCGVASLALLGASSRASSADEAPVKLSPFEVRAQSAEFKRWIKISSPNFVIYTDATAADASNALRKFEMLRWAAQPLFGRTAMNLGPVTVVMPTARSDWRKLESKDAVEWESAVTSIGHGVTEMIVVQHDWQDEGLASVFAILAHADARRLDLEGPFWFRLGMASMYEMVEFDKTNVVFGRASPRMAQFTTGADWLPWQRFFEVTPRSEEYVKQHRNSQFTGQASVFTHYLFTNEDRAWTQRLAAWLQYVNAGHSPTEVEFKAVFGQDWKAWQRTMNDYVSNGKYRLYTVRVPSEAVKYTETVSPLLVSEMRELFVLAQIILREVPASEVALDGVLTTGIKSECLRELLTAACIDKRRTESALAELRRLIAANSGNPRVYTMASELRLMETADKGDGPARLGSEATEARKWLLKAIEIEPRLRAANESLAYVEAFGPTIDQHSFLTIEQAYRNLRGHAPTHNVVVALAMAAWRTGDTATARELAEKVGMDPNAGRDTRILALGIVDFVKAGRSVDEFTLKGTKN